MAAFLQVPALFYVLFMVSARSTTVQKCRCLSTDACWPDEATWKSFNSSIQGKLIAVSPPAAPCHDPHYNQKACETATVLWGRPFWRTDQPGAMINDNWEMNGDKGCFINANRTSPCDQGAVPTYAVNATQVSYVQLAVQFASKYNLRLVIRNTGHDYNGRSTAAGAFSIWMHNLRNISFYSAFIPENCYYPIDGTVSAATIGAGVQWEDAYAAAYKLNYSIVGGRYPSVGAAGGFPQGGGHSVLSPTYGLTADNILQYQVITADGKLSQANFCENEDLFWALRGGGGGTFAVVVSATHRVRPTITNVVYAEYNFTMNATTLQKMLIRFMDLNPTLSDAGWSGYFTPTSRYLSVRYVLPNKNMSVANATITPLLMYAQQQAIPVSGGMQLFSTFHDWRMQIQCQGQESCKNISFSSMGVPNVIASRLIPRTAIMNSQQNLTQAFLKIMDMKVQIEGNLVAGGQVTKGQFNAVNPAWRKALWHIVLSTGWVDGASKSTRQAAAKLVTKANQLLIDTTPGSGSYMNEGDYNEPNWQQSFFGDNYPRLLSIKKQVDPNGLFTCHNCVGSEYWRPDLNCRLTG